MLMKMNEICQRWQNFSHRGLADGRVQQTGETGSHDIGVSMFRLNLQIEPPHFRMFERKTTQRRDHLPLP